MVNSKLKHDQECKKTEKFDLIYSFFGAIAKMEPVHKFVLIHEKMKGVFRTRRLYDNVCSHRPEAKIE